MVNEYIQKIKDNLSENGNDEYTEQPTKREGQNHNYISFTPMSCFQSKRT